ncbi:MAG: hypothetical protein EOO81_03735 [Oxalobacteraceae bacterium]|nr:MAG: hypothetical protein EOO81_03735 [Oxalobacteraceae bacterium]
MDYSSIFLLELNLRENEFCGPTFREALALDQDSRLDRRVSLNGDVVTAKLTQVRSVKITGRIRN